MNIRPLYHARRALIYDCDAIRADFLNIIVHEPLVRIDRSELPRCRSRDKIHTCLRQTALRRMVVQCIIGEVRVRFTQAARKHRVSYGRARHVIDNPL